MAPSPVFIVRWKRPLGAGAALLSAPSLPSHNQGCVSAHVLCPDEAGAVSDISHATQGSWVAYPEMITVGT